MKKKEVNNIFEDDTNRNRRIFKFIITTILLFVFALLLLCIFLNNNKVKYANYDENSKINYKVFLKENEFFDGKYLESDKQYISSLIDYITATFEYDLSLKSHDVTYKYSYRVAAEVNVKDRTSKKNLYTYSENLVKEQVHESAENDLAIIKNVNIDYNKYNNLIKSFVKTYDVGDVNSTLDVKMYVKVIGSCEDFDSDTQNESVITLSIPLTLKTIGIDISNDLVKSVDNVMVCGRPSSLNYIFLVMSLGLCVLAFVNIIKLFMYINDTKTAKDVYQKELKKILNNYGPYIQKVNGKFDLKGYQALKIDSFTDMLEIRDTLQQPVLMVENNTRNGVFFIIPSNTKIIYVYSIRVSDIEKEMNKDKDLDV